MEIRLKGSRLSYAKSGAGARHMLLFHGAGQDRTAFDPICYRHGDRFTFYAIDLFFHGDSVWAGPGPVAKTDWQELIGLLLSKEGIQRFCVAGFSIGARCALVTAELYPDQIEHVYLLAPEGLRISPWYRLATGTSAGRAMFSFVTRRPGALPAIASAARRLGLVGAPVLRFVSSQWNNAENRRRVRMTWLAFRKLTPATGVIARYANEGKFRLTIYVASRDAIVTPSSLAAFIGTLAAPEVVTVISGHHNLIGRAAAQFARDSGGTPR